MARGEGGRHPSFATDRLLPSSAARLCSAFAIASSTNATAFSCSPSNGSNTSHSIELEQLDLRVQMGGWNHVREIDRHPSLICFA
jgi:hypothetical protein